MDDEIAVRLKTRNYLAKHSVMKTIKLLLISSLFLLTAFMPGVPTLVGQQQPDSSQTLVPGKETFKNGEELVYKIYYNLNFIWVAAGEVTFKVFDEGKQFHYQALGRTYSSYEWFYTVKDDYNSWVDKATFLPNYSERSVLEGKYSIFEKISFDHNARKSTVWRSKKRGMEETKTEHPLKADAHDVLSVLYFLRTMEFQDKSKGHTVPFTIFMDKEEFPLSMRYLGKDTNKKVHGMGRYRTLQFQPDVIVGNVFNENSKMRVWVSDDANKIPVLIETPISVGSVKMVLKSYKGLKFDFTAKVE